MKIVGLLQHFYDILGRKEMGHFKKEKDLYLNIYSF